MAKKQFDATLLEALYETIEARRGANPDESYTAKLFERGTPKIAQKLGEEATEAVIELVRGDRAALAQESADLLYHLLVAWADAGVKPQEVWAALASREGVSGIVEKKARKTRSCRASNTKTRGTKKG